MCGVIGIIANDPVGQELYDGLSMLQHRGQDAAGIATFDNGRIHIRKSKGMVRDVFHTRHMLNLPGRIGIGHVRYPTAGGYSSAEAQPFYVNSPYGIALSHNGNLVNNHELKEHLYKEDLRHINTDSDSEVLLNVFAHKLQSLRKNCVLRPEDIFTATQHINECCRGGYAVVVMIVGVGIVGFRDPHGIRPLVYGTRHITSTPEHMIASESVALTALGFSLVDDIPPGGAVFIGINGQVHIMDSSQRELSPCIFEYVYLARPDSIINGVSVIRARMSMGRTLAKKILREWSDHDINAVIPIPDTSRPAAQELASCLGVAYREGFIRNRYIPRTFIMPGQQIRQRSVRQKLSIIDLEFKDKNVLLVDDSIVRGTTAREITRMAGTAGAKKVYFASASPPVRYPNFYGIDMPTYEELIANGRTEEEVARMICADKIIYQDIEDLELCVQNENPDIKHFDSSCFTGKYIAGER